MAINKKIIIKTVIKSAKGIQWLSFFVPDIFEKTNAKFENFFYLVCLKPSFN